MTRQLSQAGPCRPGSVRALLAILVVLVGVNPESAGRYARGSRGQQAARRMGFHL
jgi:hypothetical protein